ncbi:unnamed protein product [Coregonus sp. 'balchen']|nr:unnamed protein product [Coregonus sp. 'balchen']
MEAERSGGVAGGTNQNSGGSGVGRNPNGPKSVLGQGTTEAAAAAATAGAMAGSSQPREPQDGDAGLSLPGILHFIQFEWGRFQAEKYRWEAERDELRAQVTFLQGERKGQENMKQDLVRRIKMLEYALKQERTKHQKLKTGMPNGPAESESEQANQMSWKEGRQLLRKYLEEVGYSDTILDMRSKRVRSLLGHTSPEANGAPASSEQQPTPDPEPLAGGESLLIRQIEEQIKSRNAAGKDGSKERLGGSVLDKIPFLHGCEDDDEDDSDEEDDFQGTDCIDGQRNKNKKPRVKIGTEPMTTDLDPDDEEDEDDSEDALSEFDFLGSGEEGEGAGEAQNRRNKFQGMMSDFPPKPSPPPSVSGQSRSGEGGALGFSSDVFILDAVGGGDMNLGELADLTVANDNDLTVDDNREEFKKTWNPRFTLRSHFDAIRALTFHPSQAVLLTASEDGTLKLNAALDVEPIYTFRAHSGAVLSLAMGEDGDSCYSGGLDGTVRCWKIPDINVDPYDNYEQSIMVLETGTKDGSELINCVVSHPSEPISITAHENRTIRYLDNKTGKVIHSMVAHLDAVTCHDCSVRLWMLDNRTCVQEITAHRKKHDEAIHDVAFHPSQPFIASAGADALAKIFV